MLRAFSLAAVAVAASAQAAAQDPPAKLRVLLISGANNHDWEWTAPEWEAALVDSGRFEVDVTYRPGETFADPEALQGYDVFFLDYNGPRWGDSAEQAFDAAVRAGTGVTVIHAANNAFRGWRAYEELVCLCWRDGTGHGGFHRFDVTVRDREHPITRDMPDLVGHPDELYHRLVHMYNARHRVLATALSSEESGGTGKHEPMIIVRRHGDGRVFHTPLGHVWRGQEGTKVSVRDPQLRQLVLRGTEWAASGAVTLPPTGANALSADEREQGFELLFDGMSFDGLRGFGKDAFPEQGWDIDRGALRHVAGAGGGDVMTAAKYGDFDLRFEWAVAEGGNSGVMYRVSEDESPSYRTGPEYQILDDAALGERPDPLVSAAALYGLVAPAAVVLRPVGEFNTARIVVRGMHAEHWLNGVKVCEYDLEGEDWDARVAASKFKDWSGFGRHREGHIVFQDHGDTVWYRSIRVRRL